MDWFFQDRKKGYQFKERRQISGESEEACLKSARQRPRK